MKPSAPASSQQQQRGDLCVYDFDADEEAVEVISERYTSKLQSKLSYRHRCGIGDGGYEATVDGLMDNALTKHDFLRHFSSGDASKQGSVTGVWAVDLSESNHDPESRPIEVPDSNLDSSAKAELDRIIRPSSSRDEGDKMCIDESEDGSLEQATDVISEVDEGSCRSSTGCPSITDSDIEEHDGCSDCPVSGNFFTTLGNMDDDDDDVAVMVSPDYVVYESTFYGESQLTFASDYIKIVCSDTSGSDDKLVSEWSSDDIIHIYCRWSGSIQAALVHLGLRAHTVTGTDELHSIPNALQVMFSISDIHWLEKEHRIKNLSERYKELWKSHSRDDSFWEDDAMDRSLLCYTEMPQPFEDVVYPKGDPDAVTISRRDFELLQPETFINDTIIDFYIKYLKNKIQEDAKHRFYFFNSFFFRKLADLDKDRFSDSEGREAFLRVRKWTRKVNIFEKDYIFIPVNFNLHWSLLVICHPGEIEKLKDDNVEESAKVPCILHMDSIKGTHSGLKNIIQSYICEEWKERHPVSSEVDSTRFLNLRFVPLELPQQENSFDCGLFLLHYVELFLEEAPEGFNPLKVTKFSSFLNVDWFQPAEASQKRSFIRKLIYKLLIDSSEKSPATCRNNAIYSVNPANDVKQEPLVSEQCSPANDEFCQVVDTRNEAELLQTSAFSECEKETGLVLLQEFLEPEPAKVPFFSDMEHVNQPSCPTTEHKNENDQFTSQLVMMMDPSDDVGTAVNSIEESVADTVSSPNLLNTNTIIDVGNENEKVGIVSPESVGHVLDYSPSSSSGGNSDAHIEGSQEIDVSKGEPVKCDASETDGENDVDCKDISISIAEGGKDKDDAGSINIAEGGKDKDDAGSINIAEGGKDKDIYPFNKDAEGGKDKDIYPFNKDDAGEGGQVPDLKKTEVSENKGFHEIAYEAELELCGCPEIGRVEQRSCGSQISQPSASCPDIVITDDEHSSDSDGAQLMESRELQTRKRRRVTQITFNGSRRYTRSVAHN